MAAISSAADGTWIAGAATTWVGGVAPAEGDTVTILNTHDVEIDGDIIVGADSATAAIQVNSGGSLFVPSTVAGNYTLTLKGDLKTDATGGTISFGTAANPIPNTRTFTVKLNYSAALADGKYGLIIAAGGTFNCQGADRWSSGLTDPDRCLLASDEAVNSTEWTSNGSTAWLDNDVIAIASTSRTYSECEKGTLAANAAGTTLTVDGFGGVGGGLAYAHSGTSPTQAEIINLTRNVKITAYNTTYVGYVFCNTSSVSDIDWTEFSYLGEAAANKRGIELAVTTGSFSLNRSSIYNCEDGGIYFANVNVNNVTTTNNVFYDLSNTTNAIYLASTKDAINHSNNWYVMHSSNIETYSISLTGAVTFEDNLVAGGRTSGFYFYGWPAGTGTFDNITTHSCSGYGIRFNNYTSPNEQTFTNLTSWRNSSWGIQIRGTANIKLATITCFGNTNANVSYTNNCVLVTLDGLVSNGDSTFSTTSGLDMIGPMIDCYILNCDFSTAGGIKTAHTNDINISTTYGDTYRVYFDNNKHGGTNTVTNFTRANAVVENSFLSMSRFNQTAGLAGKKCYVPDGIITADTSYYHTASPSEKLAPSIAAYKMKSGTIQIPVASAANPTISVYFRKSAAYNGNQPRLRVRRNDELGITVDATLATSAAAVDVDVAPGTFTQLSGQPGAVSADGVLEVYVDCDGTAGYINICDWAVTGAKTQADNLDVYYNWGLPFNGLLSATAAAGGGGPIFKSGGIFN